VTAEYGRPIPKGFLQVPSRTWYKTTISVFPTAETIRLSSCSESTAAYFQRVWTLHKGDSITNDSYSLLFSTADSLLSKVFVVT